MKKLLSVFVIVLVTFNLMAQEEPDTTNTKLNEQELPQITVFAEDLESDERSQDISGLLQSSSDIFISTAGYTFGQTRFKIRGIYTEYSSVMINGIPLNDMESGRAYWGAWGGLNDATRNKEINSGVSASQYTFGRAGGSTNIIARASTFAKGTKLTYSSTNRSYRNRLMFITSTGMKENGWAFTLSGSRRWAQEGYIEGTFYNAWAYFLSAEKKINRQHSLGLIAYAAPSSRGRNGVSTNEAYDLYGSNFYNPYWGYQNGEKRNSRISNYHQPMFILTHYWDVNSKTSINSSVYYTFGRGGSTALEWYAGADPRPDYYKKLPSWDGDYGGTPEERDELWRTDASYRQINWDDMYAINRNNIDRIDNADGIKGNSVTGLRSNYIVEDRRNDKSHLGFNVNLNHEINSNVTLSGGLNMSRYKGYHFKVVDDLLGGDFYVDYDKWIERSELQDSSYMHNDLNVENNIVKEGDRFGYDYTTNINDYSVFGQAEFVYGNLEYYFGGTLKYNEFWRTGNMRNGKFPDESEGDSEKQEFFTYGIKGGLLYKITGRHMVRANAMYMTQAPWFRSSYMSSRTRDHILNDLRNEKIMSVDASYIYRSPYVKSRLTGYYLTLQDQVYLRFLYHEVLRSFGTYLMTGVDKKHYGLEYGLEAKVSQNITLIGVAALGRNLYDSRPDITITVDNVAEVLSNRTAYIENYNVGGSPQTALSAGFKYFSSYYIYGGVNVNYFDDMYIEINPDRRTIEGPGNYGQDYPERYNVINQEKMDPESNFTVNVYIGKSWRIDYKYYISLNFSVSNLLDNRDLSFGGFEQYRYDPFQLDKFPSKYFYLYGRQYFLNLNFRF